ncbi:MAG: hypothetical protein R3E77_00445 [Steroidobacteraceae bacterium]
MTNSPGLKGFLSLGLLVCLLAGCGQDAPPQTYTIGGTITGLKNPALELLAIYEFPDGSQSNEFITATANGPFSFTKALPSGTLYEVLAGPDPLALQSPVQRCDGANSAGATTGVIASANVDDIQIVCKDAYRVSGVVTGLENVPKSNASSANILVLNVDVAPATGWLNQPNIRDNGTFESEIFLLAGESYEVTVLQQPGDPTQTCSVFDGRGTIVASNVTNIRIDCTSFAIGGTVVGLSGTGLQLAISADPDPPPIGGPRPLLDVELLDISANGPFQFDLQLPDGAYYQVNIKRQPTNPPEGFARGLTEICRIENAEGYIAGQDVDNIRVICPEPKRAWKYYGNDQSRIGPPSVLWEDEKTGGVVDDIFDFNNALDGGMDFNRAGRYGNINPIFARYFNDDITHGAVHSSASGETFWTAVESARTGYGSRSAWLRSTWHFRKAAPATKLTFHLTHVNLFAENDVGPVNGLQPSFGSLFAGAFVVFEAYKVDPATGAPEQKSFYLNSGAVALDARADPIAERTRWDYDAFVSNTGLDDLWTRSDFEFVPNQDALGRGTGFVNLVRTIPVDIDLTDLAVGEEFIVDALAITQAWDSYTQEFGASMAYFRDPATFDPNDPDAGVGGMALIDAEGLALLDVPDGVEAPGEGSISPIGGCQDNAAEKSILEFDTAEYRVSERELLTRQIKVKRSGNPAGLVSANVTLTPGSAAENIDYVARDYLLRFGDFSVSPRIVDLSIIDDPDEEPDETLTLTLGNPGGCAIIGPQATATVVIVDDDAVAETYTVGGVVSGLAGSGLVLWESITSQQLDIATSGAFTYPRRFGNGSPYNVQVTAQPDNPAQNCTVTNGAGTINAASVANITVACTTLSASTGLDPAFGSAGKTVDSALSGAVDVALLGDGKVLVLSSDNKVSRYGADGLLDTGFGTGGYATININGPGRDFMTAFAVQADGAIVVVGYSKARLANATDDFVVLRLNADGTPDLNFGGQGTGIVLTDFALATDRATDVLIQPDGAIVATGHAQVLAAQGNDFAAVRFDSTGALDASFGNGGKVSTDIAGQTDLAYAAALQADGSILVGGRVADSGGADPDFGLVRYSANGQLDASFNGSGILIDSTNYWDEVRDLLAQPDGRIVAVGYAGIGVPSLVMRRYNSDGSRDNLFGTSGSGEVLDDSLYYGSVHGSAAALEVDGDIVVVGTGNSDFAIARYDPLGQRDNGFDSDGLLSIDFFGGLDDARAVAIQPDGKIIAAGEIRNGVSAELGLVRVVP